MDEKSDSKAAKHPDRPLECSGCKRPITVHYTEIINNTETCTGMCDSCPELEKKLKGNPNSEERTLDASKAGLVCGECDTALDTLRISHTIGCSHCYEVFGDLIVEDLLSTKQVPPTIVKKGKRASLHLGRSPGETKRLSPSLKLIALNEALEETLKKEDYEQAAWLRDQIKDLTNESGGPDGTKG